jgi:hypothetical protein
MRSGIDDRLQSLAEIIEMIGDLQAEFLPQSERPPNFQGMDCWFVPKPECETTVAVRAVAGYSIHPLGLLSRPRIDRRALRPHPGCWHCADWFGRETTRLLLKINPDKPPKSLDKNQGCHYNRVQYRKPLRKMAALLILSIIRASFDSIKRTLK